MSVEQTAAMIKKKIDELAKEAGERYEQMCGPFYRDAVELVVRQVLVDWLLGKKRQ